MKKIVISVICLVLVVIVGVGCYGLFANTQSKQETTHTEIIAYTERLNGKIMALENQVADYEAQIIDLEKQLNTSAEFEKINVKIDTLKELITNCKNQIAELQQELANISADLATLTSTITLARTLTISGDWQDTGISGDDLASGVYIYFLRFVGDGFATYLWDESMGGTLNWYSGGCNDNHYHLVPGNMAGHASNSVEVELRVIRQYNAEPLKLQIKFGGQKLDNPEIHLIFTFRKLLGGII